MSIETLTDEDRKQLLSFGDYGERAVELIDAYAADRAALVAKLEAAQADIDWKSAYEDSEARKKQLVAQVAELTRERDEARREALSNKDYLDRQLYVLTEARSEVTRLTEALAAAEGTPDEGESDLSAALARVEAETERAEAAEARVRELEALIAKGVA